MHHRGLGSDSNNVTAGWQLSRLESLNKSIVYLLLFCARQIERCNRRTLYLVGARSLTHYLIDLAACVRSFVKKYWHLASLNLFSAAGRDLVELLLLCYEMNLLGLRKHRRLMRAELLSSCHLHWVEHVLTHAEVLVLVCVGRNLKTYWVHCLIPCWV